MAIRFFRKLFPVAAASGLIFLAACGSSTEISSRPAPPADQAPPATCEELWRIWKPVPKTPVTTHSRDAARHFTRRMKQFAKAPLEPGQIVMLGDSLTELHDWSTIGAVGPKLLNRGISGDTSDGILVRTGEVAASRPKAVFILIGTNDLWTDNAPLQTACNIRAASEALHAQSPETEIIVQTVFPQNWAPEANSRVRAINAFLTQESTKAGFTLLDTYSALIDSSGRLNPAYTDDGLHLNDAGYAVWTDLIGRTLEQKSPAP